MPAHIAFLYESQSPLAAGTHVHVATAQGQRVRQLVPALPQGALNMLNPLPPAHPA